MPGRILFDVGTFTNYSTSDYNGFRPNDGARFSFQWNSPPVSVQSEYDKPTLVRKFATLAAYSEATGQDRHSRLVDWSVFKKAIPPDNTKPTTLYRAEDYDFSLRDGGAAIDGGCVLPNVNDGFKGAISGSGRTGVGPARSRLRATAVRQPEARPARKAGSETAIIGTKKRKIVVYCR